MASLDRPPQRPPAHRVIRSDKSPWNWLLVPPIVLPMLVPLYNHTDPELGGIPFFYWFQMLCIPLGVVCTTLVYRNTRGL